MTKPLLIVYARRDAFGDGLCRLPALRAARTAFPDWHIVYAVTDFTSLTRSVKRYTTALLDETRDQVRLPALLKELDAGKRQTAVADLRMTPPQLLGASLSLIGKGIRYEANFPGHAVSLLRTVPYQPRPEHNAWRYHRLIERLAGRRLPFDHRLSVPESARVAARQIIGDDPRQVILMCGNHYMGKSMTTEQTAATATRLLDQGFRVFYLKTPGHGPDAEGLAASDPRLSIIAPSPGQDLAAFDDLILALAEMATAYVGPEGGMAHLMATVLVPIVIINHGIRVERWRPLSNFVEVVEAPKASASGTIADVPPDLIVAGVRRLVTAIDRDRTPR